MAADINFWHARFKQQASWSQKTRSYLLDKLDIPHSGPILEVGCGTGSVLEWFLQQGFRPLYGIDLNFLHLAYAKKLLPYAEIVQSHANQLPYPKNTFQLVYTHYFFLWLKNPAKILTEMKRVTQRNGFVFAFAEPDYGGRIDYPPKLEKSGELQIKSLLLQGANPFIGRQLPSLFIDAGFRKIGYGILGGEWEYQRSETGNEIELDVLNHDLNGFINENKAEAIIDEEIKAKKSGKRILFVPTFYAWGMK